MIAGAPIQIGDIANAEAFVEKTLAKSGIRFTPDEHEELLAEGLAILLQLHAKYRPLPMRPGIDKQAGRFSGYAAWGLPKRLGDFHHRQHRDSHHYLTNPATKKRAWVYTPGALSLDGLGAGGGGEQREGHLLHARTLDAFCPAPISFPTSSTLGVP